MDLATQLLKKQLKENNDLEKKLNSIENQLEKSNQENYKQMKELTQCEMEKDALERELQIFKMARNLDLNPVGTIGSTSETAFSTQKTPPPSPETSFLSPQTPESKTKLQQKRNVRKMRDVEIEKLSDRHRLGFDFYLHLI